MSEIQAKGETPAVRDELTTSRRINRRARPVALYLVALVLVIIIPALVVTLVLIKRTNDAQESVVQALTSATVQAMGQAVEREISGMITTLRVLSSDQALLDGDYARFHQRSLIALAGSGSYLLAVDDQMQQILNTRVSFGEPLSITANAATARRAFDRRMATVSDLFFGNIAQTWVFNVWLPVDAGAIKLLSLTQNARDLVPVLQSRELPQGWHAALVDGSNGVISATPDTGLGIGDVLPIRRGASPQESWVEEQLNNETVITSEWRSGLTGWRIVAWASASTVRQPLGESLVQLAAWGAIIAIAASAIAVVIAQKLGQSVSGLRRDAQRLGRGEVVYERFYPVTEIDEVSGALSLASRQRQAAERDVHFLMRELAHRSKNQMAVISAMAKQTARGATDIADYVAAFERRILGLARSTDLLLAHGRAGVSLSELVALQLAPFRPPDDRRVSITGDDIRINPQGAQILGMALHEMAVNAMRFGALADDDGELGIKFERQGASLRLTWRETLSRPLVSSEHKGFGTTVLRTMVGGALGAVVEHIEHPNGVEWSFQIPLSALDPSFSATRPDERDL
ncbi:sensor histidine kinase [Devosia sp. SD17-2]|uniref:sensor histidine kinase n=1 Tax=Devosia sp. SD17-2 TaxID=2976459 RepID=UPI0023D7C21F|nr:sensor histidine kinase [Devosia sp. SD17-2]WEJ33316.1 sensor histidine kinase [Devosia sp. SD17-2]